jgi:2-iminobutanoate/2-iminopropanoate deaminase
MKKIFISLLFILATDLVFCQNNNLPAPIAPYSPGVMTNGTLYISGQIAIIPATKEMVKGSIEEETKQVMENLGAVLKSNGMSYSNLVNCTVYLTDINNYKIVNDIYGSYFPDKKYPARVAVQVAALPKGANIEISGIAVK